MITSDQYFYTTCSHSKGSWGYSRNVFVIELVPKEASPVPTELRRSLTFVLTLGKKSYVCTDDFSFKKAHYAVLQQSSLVDPYIEEHKKILLSEFAKKSEADYI